jgi:hypothetical protein
MKRVLLLVSVGVVMTVALALVAGAAGAEATTVCRIEFGSQFDYRVCTTTTVEQTTEFVVKDLGTEVSEVPGVSPCTVGSSGRVGTQEGITTQEIRTTSTQEVLVTTTTVTRDTYIYGSNYLLSSVTSPPTVVKEDVGDPEVTTEVVSESFEPTGRCKNAPGKQG